MSKIRRTRSQIAESGGSPEASEGRKSRRTSLVPIDSAIPASVLNASDTRKRKIITEVFVKQYKVQPRILQVESVLNLVNKKNTFLLAGTGYGKTRIAELYYHLFQKRCRSIVLVINPLDALGDNQVCICLSN